MFANDYHGELLITRSDTKHEAIDRQSGAIMATYDKT